MNEGWALLSAAISLKGQTFPVLYTQAAVKYLLKITRTYRQRIYTPLLRLRGNPVDTHEVVSEPAAKLKEESAPEKTAYISRGTTFRLRLILPVQCWPMATL